MCCWAVGCNSGLDVNPILDYQVAAVAHWNATDGKRPRAYNMSHRCVPDISAFDTSYQVFVAGGIQVRPPGPTVVSGPTTDCGYMVAHMRPFDPCWAACLVTRDSQPVGGTSCAAPVAAGVFSMVYVAVAA